MTTELNPDTDRRHFIGGSDAAAVLGVSPWKTALQLWQQKTATFDEPADAARSRVLRRGQRMEPYVCDLLAEETGLVIARRNARYIDPEHPFLAAEIDAEAESGENVEIKTVHPFKAAEWGDPDSDSIPLHYTAQAQHGMMVHPSPVCVFGVLIGGDDFRVYRVERDEELIATIRAREVAFWREHVETLVPPPPANTEDLARLFPRDSGAAVEATTEALIALNELRDLTAQASDLSQRIEACRDVLKRAIGEASRLTVDGCDVATWRTQSARRFDLRAFQDAHPELYGQFLKTSETRVLRLR